MSKCKRILSGFLMIVMVFTAIWSSGTIVHASMLPLKEEKAYLVLNGKTNKELSSMKINDMLNMLVDKNGNSISISKDATTVWRYIKSNDDGIEVYKEYKIDTDGIIDENEIIDLSYQEGMTSYQMELIVGKDGQLNAKNTRYIIKVYVSNEYSENINFELYQRTSNGKTKVKPLHTDCSESKYTLKTMEGDTKDVDLIMYGQVLESPIDRDAAYLNITSERDEHPSITTKVYDWDSYNANVSSGYEKYAPITDEIWNQDMTLTNAGYSLNNSSNDSFTFVVNYYFDDVLFDVKIVSVLFAAGYINIDGKLYLEKNDTYVDVVDNVSYIVDANDRNRWDIDIELKENYVVDDEYNFKLDIRGEGEIDQSFNDLAEKAVLGHYDSLEEASGQEDIKNSLLTDRGYKANYSGEGIDFTVFFPEGTFSDGNVIKFTIKTLEYQEDFREFTEKPIIGEADPWLRITGATDSDGNEYDTYVVENGKNINMDTYYGYGYQTIFINDANADLTALKPTFWYANTDRVYAVSKDSGNRVDENHIRDFSEENQQYTGVIFDNNKENEKNYWVTFKKLNNNGPELYVYGPSEREVILDEYFEFKHDILIANIGNAPLEDISVELADAENVKLDEYWTVGGDGNDTLAPFTSTSTDTQYGELDNLAKIRLLPDGDGEVKGTLIIKAKGQNPVMITLNGTAQNPEIVTETMADAVKYVPYQQIVATNNMHDWVDTQFSISEGSLPDGVELNSDTGEIYGVPTVAETDKETTYSFTVKAEYLVEGEAGYFDPSYKDYQLTVKPNTDENVYLASDSDEGYSIKQPIGTQTGEYSFELEEIADTVFTSNGEYDEFVGLWLNGELLQPGTDYDSEPGSTKLTIRSQTFDDYADKDGINTIAMEFRKDTDGDGKGDKGAEMNRTAQNFTVKKETSKPSQSEIDHAAADRVISLIGSIPSSVTLNDKGTINKARTAYNALTDSQQKLVTNYSRLTRAEVAIKQLEKNAKDKAAADKVVSMINALPDWIKLDNKGEVNAARNAYNMLTASQKGYVSNYGKLQEAEAVIAKLEKETGKTESVTFVGILVDKNDNAYADRFVELHSDVQNGRTDENGSFQFNDVEFGKHTIYVKNTNGDTVAKKEFYIRSGSPLSVSDDGIIAENGSVFTVKIQLDGDELTFLNIEEENKAPTVTLREDVNSIDIGDDGKLSESGSPQTGENADLTVWYILLAVSLSVLVFTGYIKIKKRRYERRC